MGLGVDVVNSTHSVFNNLTVSVRVDDFLHLLAQTRNDIRLRLVQILRFAKIFAQVI